MKTTLFAIALTVLTQNTAFAGSGGCAQDVMLACSTSFNEGTVKGPSAKALVEDIQPEPFDPSACQASVYMETPVGRFVAVYDADDSSLRAWVNKNGKDSFLVKETPIRLGTVWSISVPTTGATGIHSATLTCNLVD